jgi:hypothetical protein
MFAFPNVFASKTLARVLLNRVYEYWVTKRAARSTGSSFLRCYHDFIMENWQHCQVLLLPYIFFLILTPHLYNPRGWIFLLQGAMPKLLPEDDDLQGLLDAHEQLCILRRDMVSGIQILIPAFHSVSIQTIISTGNIFYFVSLPNHT